MAPHNFMLSPRRTRRHKKGMKLLSLIVLQVFLLSNLGTGFAEQVRQQEKREDAETKPAEEFLDEKEAMPPVTHHWKLESVEPSSPFSPVQGLPAGQLEVMRNMAEVLMVNIMELKDELNEADEVLTKKLEEYKNKYQELLPELIPFNEDELVFLTEEDCKAPAKTFSAFIDEIKERIRAALALLEGTEGTVDKVAEGEASSEADFDGVWDAAETVEKVRDATARIRNRITLIIEKLHEKAEETPELTCEPTEMIGPPPTVQVEEEEDITHVPDDVIGPPPSAKIGDDGEITPGLEDFIGPPPSAKIEDEIEPEPAPFPIEQPPGRIITEPPSENGTCVVKEGETVVLNGSSISRPKKPGEFELTVIYFRTFEWNVILAPEHGTGEDPGYVLEDADSSRATFVGQRPGAYIVELVVAEGPWKSKPHRIEIVVEPKKKEKPEPEEKPAPQPHPEPGPISIPGPEPIDLPEPEPEPVEPEELPHIPFGGKGTAAVGERVLIGDMMGDEVGCETSVVQAPGGENNASYELREHGIFSMMFIGYKPGKYVMETVVTIYEFNAAGEPVARTLEPIRTVVIVKPAKPIEKPKPPPIEVSLSYIPIGGEGTAKVGEEVLIESPMPLMPVQYPGPPPVKCEWSVAQAPGGEDSYRLEGDGAYRARFTGFKPGKYVIELVRIIGDQISEPIRTTIVVKPAKPIEKPKPPPIEISLPYIPIGGEGTAKVGEEVLIESPMPLMPVQYPGPPPVKCEWSVVQAPGGEDSYRLEGDGAYRARFTGFKPGKYVIELVRIIGDQVSEPIRTPIVVKPEKKEKKEKPELHNDVVYINVGGKGFAFLPVGGRGLVPVGQEVQIDVPQYPAVMDGSPRPTGYKWKMVKAPGGKKKPAYELTESGKFTGFRSGEYVIELATTFNNGEVKKQRTTVVVRTEEWFERHGIEIDIEHETGGLEPPPPKPEVHVITGEIHEPVFSTGGLEPQPASEPEDFVLSSDRDDKTDIFEKEPSEEEDDEEEFGDLFSDDAEEEETAGTEEAVHQKKLNDTPPAKPEAKNNPWGRIKSLFEKR